MKSFINRTEIHARRLTFIGCLLLLAVQPILAQQDSTKLKFADKITHWQIAYGMSGPEFMEQLRNKFKASAFAEVYIEGTIDHGAWMFTLLNKVTKFRYQDKTTPYVLFEVKFKPTTPDLDGYQVLLTLTASQQISANLNTIASDAAAKYLGNKIYTDPSIALPDIEKTLTEAMAVLDEKLGDELAPNLMVRYKDEVFWNGHKIPITDVDGNYVELEAIGKDGKALSPDDITWTNADPFQSKGVVDMTGINTKSVTLTKAGDDKPLVVTITRADIQQDLKEMLKMLIVEVLSTKKQQAVDTISILKGDSATNATQVSAQIAKLEQGNYPLEDIGVRPVGLFSTPPDLSQQDEAIFNLSNERKKGFDFLRKRKRLSSTIRKKVNVVAFANLVVDQPEKMNVLLEALLTNSGRLIARLILNTNSDGQRDAIRNIVVDFLNRNLEQIAGGAFGFEENEVLPAFAPVGVTSIPADKRLSPANRLYINPDIEFHGKSTFITRMTHYLDSLDTPTYVVVNYSQDISTDSYISRAKAVKPKDIPVGYTYFVFTLVNIPGSTKAQLVAHSDFTLGIIAQPLGHIADNIAAIVRREEQPEIVGRNIYAEGILKAIKEAYSSTKQLNLTSLTLPGNLSSFSGTVKIGENTYTNVIVELKEPDAVTSNIGSYEQKLLPENNGQNFIAMYSSSLPDENYGTFSIRLSENSPEDIKLLEIELFDKTIIDDEEIIPECGEEDKPPKAQFLIRFAARCTNRQGMAVTYVNEGYGKYLCPQERFALIKCLTNSQIPNGKENAIVKLIEETPRGHMAELLTYFEQDNTGVLKKMNSGFQLGNYVTVFKALRELYVYGTTDLKSKIDNISSNFWKEKTENELAALNAFFWYERGLLKKITDWDVRQNLCRDVTIADNGKISFLYSTYPGQKDEMPINLEPFELVCLLLRGNPNDALESEAGYSVYVPAIFLVALINEREWLIWRDGLNMGAVGSGVTSLITGGGKMLIAGGIDILLGTTGLIVDSYKGEILKMEHGEEFIDAYIVVNNVFLAYWSGRIVFQLATALTKLRTAYSALKSSGDWERLRISNPSKANQIEKEVEAVIKNSDNVLAREQVFEEIAQYRKDNSLPEYSQGDFSTGATAKIEINGQKKFGSNSTAKTYTLSLEERRKLFDLLISKGKLVDKKTGLQLKHLGEAPFLSHAEAEVLIKAKKEGIVFPKEFNLFVDRVTCPHSCRLYLADLLGELGIDKIYIYWKNQSGPPLPIEKR